MEAGLIANDALVVVILAGGASSRMGTDKALLRLPDRRTALERLILTARVVTGKVLVSVDDAGHAERLRAETSAPMPDLLIDRMPGAGPLFALTDALQIAGIEAVILLAVDTPLILPEVLQAFFQAFVLSDVDAVVPVITGVSQPLPALYAARLAPRAAQLISEGHSSLRALLGHSTTRLKELQESQLREIDADLRSFSSANTPDEWQRVLTRATSEQFNGG